MKSLQFLEKLGTAFDLAHKTTADVKHSMCVTLTCVLSRIDLTMCDVTGATSKSWIKSLELILQRSNELCRKSKHVAWALPVVSYAVAIAPKLLYKACVSEAVDRILTNITSSSSEVQSVAWHCLCVVMHATCLRFSDDVHLIFALLETVIPRIRDITSEHISDFLRVVAAHKSDHLIVKVLLPWLDMPPYKAMYAVDMLYEMSVGIAPFRMEMKPVDFALDATVLNNTLIKVDLSSYREVICM